MEVEILMDALDPAAPRKPLLRLVAFGQPPQESQVATILVKKVNTCARSVQVEKPDGL